MQGDKDSRRIQILCAADAAYGPWAGVMMSGLLAHDHGAPLDFHLFSDGVRRADVRRMERMVQEHGATLNVYDVRPVLKSETEGLHISLAISRTVYARLFLDHVIGSATDRVIYLDCDILCVGSIAPIWDFDLKGEAIAAVRDIGSLTPEHLATTTCRLGLPEGQPYYNSGVMVIDVAKWRDADVGRRALAYAKRMGDRLAWWDQDAINGVMGARIQEMPAEWNCQVSPLTTPSGQEVLVHFFGRIKPWDLEHSGAFAKDYQRVLRASPWRFNIRVPNAVRRLRYSYRKRLAALKRLRARWSEPARAKS